MGMYTGISFRIKVLKTTPSDIVSFCDKLFIEHSAFNAISCLLTPEASNNLGLALNGRRRDVSKILDDFSFDLAGHSAYFDTWNWRVKEEHETYWLYETRSSAKYPRREPALSLINALKPFLLVEEGDVVYRSIHEEHPVETVLFLEAGVFVEGTGYEYEEYDSDHPASLPQIVAAYPELDKQLKLNPELHQTRLFTEEAEFTPPWNITEVRALNASNKVQRIADDRGFGF